MINLLPETEKSLIRKEYHLRLLGLWLIFAFVGTLVCFALLVPSYVLSHYQNDAEQHAVATAAANTQGPNALATLSSANALASALAPTIAATTTLPSDIIDRIVSDRGANTISSFSYSENSGSGSASPAGSPSTPTAPSIIIDGIAKNRDSLLSMNQALQAESAIASVNLPISDLALDANIPFSMTITVKGQ